MDRRTFLASAAGAAVGLAVPQAHAADSGKGWLGIATAELRRRAGSIAQTDLVAIADFAAPSSAKRFHLVNVASGTVESFLVAHGRGSDPSHSGWLRRFSNDPGSYCTSNGAYRTLGYYNGKHGRSIRLAGLDETNNNAEARAIVVHSARYVSDEIARGAGVLGRSEGCFAVAESDLTAVLSRMGPGRLLIAGRFGGLY
ncbi:murein L,D-transpeptidase catalytic domain-containing protein [Sphingomonas mali]|uniref:murein L,D-transpeptidase catalytic domain-containing protein n=1 Tax=Sphingomonas mali TaxID=40682 RepID=UPI000830F88F|nr:murein L,D-transpeptidase catalytic domain family protein [Sphingomonas mali]